METEKLFYKDPFLTEFTATVLDCQPGKNGYIVTLDRTAFYPEGGGQPADHGTLDGIAVTDVHEKSGVVLHNVEAAVDEGASLHFIEGCSAPKYNVANLHAGCVELYVKKGAKLRYYTIENWSKNMYNLNTKRALVEEGGVIEWVSGSFGSHVGCLYPMSILKGDNSRMEFTGVTSAGAGQNLDTGAKVVHVGKNTSSYMNTRSISKSGGISTFRSSVVVEKGAKGAKSAVSCQSLMLDSESRSDTIPAMDIRTKDVKYLWICYSDTL